MPVSLLSSHRQMRSCMCAQYIHVIIIITTREGKEDKSDNGASQTRTNVPLILPFQFISIPSIIHRRTRSRKDLTPSSSHSKSSQESMHSLVNLCGKLCIVKGSRFNFRHLTISNSSRHGNVTSEPHKLANRRLLDKIKYLRQGNVFELSCPAPIQICFISMQPPTRRYSRQGKYGAQERCCSLKQQSTYK